MEERNLELENQGIEQWKKKIKEIFEIVTVKIKENFVFFLHLLFDYYPNSFLCCILIARIKDVKKIQNFLCHIVIIYQLWVFNVYQLKLDNGCSFFYFLILSLFFIFAFIVLVFYNFFKSIDQKLENIVKKAIKIVVVLCIIEFVIGIFMLIISFKNSHNYELTTVEGKKMIVLSEYGDSYLVVPYSEKSKECKKKFCFFVRTYELIEKTGHNLESIIINNDEIEIKKEKFAANPK